MTSSLLPIVGVRDGLATVSSQQLAEHFGKQHKDVLRRIRDLLADLPDDEYRQRNFAPSFVEVPGPKGGMRGHPIYHMTRDGFTLLAMGFTGREALGWKLRYIEAFNAMETELRRQADKAVQAARAKEKPKAGRGRPALPRGVQLGLLEPVHQERQPLPPVVQAQVEALVARLYEWDDPEWIPVNVAVVHAEVFLARIEADKTVAEKKRQQASSEILTKLRGMHA